MVTAKLAALTTVVVTFVGLGYAWHRTNPALTSPRDPVDEIFRPASLDTVPCGFAVEPRPLMVLVLGQSNAGNHGSSLPSPDARMQATFLFEGNCYRTAGPAPGATGRNGNIWTLLAPRLARATGQPVVFSVLAVDATQVRHWIEPGKLRHRLIETLASNREHHFVPAIVLWQQGEADARAGTTRREYHDRFAQLVALLRNQGITAPIVAALSTRCRNNGSEEVRTALQDSAARDSTVRLGPDTDNLTGPFRDNGCHFTASGLDAAAELWAPAIVANR